MSDGDKQTTDNSSSEPRQTPRWRRWLTRLVILAVLLGGGYWTAAQFHLIPAWLSVTAATPRLFTHEKTAGSLALQPFTVNLADQDASRFLRVSMHLVVDDEGQVKKIEGDSLRMMRVRSAVLELLTQQTAEHLNTPDGKADLKRAIITRATAALQPAKVTDVLFADFVIQF